jgi:hypothetical protein
MDLLPWVLMVSIWIDEPQKIIPVHTQVYPNYEACMAARKLWDSNKFVALCGPKNNK